MRNFYTLARLFSLVFLLGSMSAKAQTTINLSLYDSTWNHCSLPANAIFMLTGTTTGYTASDVITLDAYYGDGGTQTATVTPTIFSGTGYFYYNLYHTYTLPGTYNVTVIATGPDGNSDTIIKPSVFTDTCGNVTGHAYMDNNGNCVFDAGDDTLRYELIELTSSLGTEYAYTNHNGLYSFQVPSGINYTVSINSSFAVGLVLTCPASGSHSFTSTTGMQVFDFGAECIAGFDLVTNGASAPFVPGQYRNFAVYGSNYSCSDMPATLTVTLDPMLTYINAIPAPTSVSGSTITWDFTAVSFIGSPYWYWMSPFTPTIQVLTSPLATIGDSLCVVTAITPSSGDLDPLNNTYTFCVPVLSSYDPNMKEVSPKGIGAQGYTAPDSWLDYTIHFQNTGTYQAFNINVVDTIDSDLDMSTFEITASSHAMTPYVTSGNIIKFDFPNINLPDSTSDEPNSHGFVKYRVKMKPGLVNGTQIENTAHIFFDYNPAIVTNTTLNTVDLSMGLSPRPGSKTFALYPNPSGTYVKISAPGAENSTAFVFDMTGKIVTTITLTGNETTVDVSTWTNGLYEILIPGSAYSVSRFQKIN